MKSDKSILKEVAYDQLISHTGRNVVMGVAILLTALLLSFVFTAGFSFITTMRASAEAAPGPGEDGAIVGTTEQYELISQRKDVKWADLVQVCSMAALQNNDFAGVQTRLLAPDKGFYRHNRILPESGTYPQAGNEIMISDTLAKRLHISRIGTEYSLQVMVSGETSKAELKEITVPVKICGIYQNPIANLSGTYEEIYTAPEFITEHNSWMPQNQQYIYVKLNNLNPLAMKSDVYGRLEKIRQDTGAEYIMTKNYNNFIYAVVSVIPAFLLLLLIMMSGYFLIYNVFSISVATDVKWFGMMKTIGTTQKQLIYIYRRQIGILSAAGVSAGILAGYFLGIVLAPDILAMTSFAMYFQKASPLGVILFTLLFAWLTVRAGISRTIKKVSSLSPMEAAVYVPHRRKKAVTVISLALSGIVFLTVGNAVFGYQTERMVERYNQEECRIWHIASQWELEEAYQPITAALCRRLGELPFVDRTDIIYKARTKPDAIIRGGLKSYEGFLGEVRLDGKLKTEADAIARIPEMAETMNLMENGNIKLQISGLPVSRIKSELQYVTILEGEWNPELFATGEYILYQSPGGRSGISPEEGDMIHAGDVLTLSFYDDLRNDYVPKEVTVMAVTKWNDPYGTGNISMSSIVLTAQSFKEIYPEYEERIAQIALHSARPFGGQEMEQIKQAFQSEGSQQLRINSRYEDRIHFTGERNAVLVMGLFFTVILGLIGVSNFINTMVMDTVFKRRQIAVIQAIGMTGKQLWRMLFMDSLKLGCAAWAIMVLIGWPAASAVASMFTGFNAAIFVGECAGVLLFILFLNGGLAYGMRKWMNRKNVMERLREE